MTRRPLGTGAREVRVLGRCALERAAHGCAPDVGRAALVRHERSAHVDQHDAVSRAPGGLDDAHADVRHRAAMLAVQGSRRTVPAAGTVRARASRADRRREPSRPRLDRGALAGPAARVVTLAAGSAAARRRPRWPSDVRAHVRARPPRRRCPAVIPCSASCRKAYPRAQASSAPSCAWRAACPGRCGTSACCRRASTPRRSRARATSAIPTWRRRAGRRTRS